MPRTSLALRCFLASTLAIVVGVLAAARHFPGGFDWVYTVISSLASPRRNPDGGRWLSGSLLVAVLLLWPVVGHLARASREWAEGQTARGDGHPRVSLAALRVALIGGVLLGIEGLFALELSAFPRKTHEALALVTFAGMYWGVLGLYLHRARHSQASVWPGVAVVLPLLAVGLSQLGLYFDQRNLGWVNTGWREMGIPFWLSFAFWQWMAVAFLGLGIGYLVVEADRRSHPSSPV